MPTSSANPRAATKSTMPRAIKCFFMAISGILISVIDLCLAVASYRKLLNRAHLTIGPTSNSAVSDRKKRW